MGSRFQFCLPSATTFHRSALPVGLCALGTILIACGSSSGAVGARAAEAPAPHLRAAAAERSAPGSVLVESVPDHQVAKEEVGLGALLAYADKRSPALVVARSTRSRAEASRAAASPLLPGNPELTVAAGRQLGPRGRGIDLDVTLMQPIEIAGQRGLRLDAADRQQELTDAEIEQIRWFVHCDVHEGFHRALVEQERVRLAERVVGFQEEVLRVVERQISSGEAAPLALRLAQAEVAQARQVLVAAQQTFRAARIRLAQLSGWPVATPPKPTGKVDAPEEPPPEARLLVVARERLPSLRAGVARVREAEARAAVADREAWPRPSLGAQYRRESGSTGDSTSDTLMGVVSLPIPSFDTNQGAKARARADATVAEAELEAARWLLDGQIAEARSAVSAAAQRARAYASEILPRFEENLTLLRRSFELGELDILALSTGRERFLRIQSDALGAQLDYFVALSELERVVGVDLWHDDHHEEKAP